MQFQIKSAKARLSVSVPGQNLRVKLRRQHGAKVEIIGGGGYGVVQKQNQDRIA